MIGGVLAGCDWWLLRRAGAGLGALYSVSVGGALFGAIGRFRRRINSSPAIKTHPSRVPTRTRTRRMTNQYLDELFDTSGGYSRGVQSKSVTA